MSKSTLRKIKFSEETYLWKVGHYHLKEFKFSECVDKVTIYLDGFKNSPLILHFRMEDAIALSQNNYQKNDWLIDSGCIIHNKKVINLNRPGVIAKLIEYYIHENWKPKEQDKPFEVEDVLTLLDSIELPNGIN